MTFEFEYETLYDVPGECARALVACDALFFFFLNKPHGRSLFLLVNIADVSEY